MKTQSKAQPIALTILALALTSPIIGHPQSSQDNINSAKAQMAQCCHSIDIDSLNGKMTDTYVQNQIELLIEQIVKSDSNKIVYDGVSYEYSEIYGFYSKEQVGYVVDVTYGDNCGYIIILVDDTSATPTEVVLGHRSPYYGQTGKYLYLTSCVYYIMTADNNIICVNVESSHVTQPQNGMMKIIGEKGVPVTINYECSNGGLMDEYNLEGMNDLYSTYLTNHDNTCANVAGVIALNYWNKYYDNKLLNLKDEEISKVNSYEYGSMTMDVAREYMEIFYDYMDTNWFFGIGGTSPDDCYKGFERLIREKGAVSGRSQVTTYDEIKSYITKYNIPVFIVSSNFYFGNMDYFEDADGAKYTYDGEHTYGLDNSHVFIAYGYAEYAIYNRRGNLTNVQLLEVATGWGYSQYFHIAKSNIMSAAVIRVVLPSC